VVEGSAHSNTRSTARAGRRPRRKRRQATEGVGAASSFSSGYPSLTGLNPIVPVAAGLLGGLVVGLINGSFIAYTKIPPFIATLGMMVSARGVADWYTNGQPIGNLTDSFAAIGAGWWPVIIFLAVAAIFHIALRYTRYGKFTYALAGCSRVSAASSTPRARSADRPASASASNSTRSPPRSLAARRFPAASAG
jgi:ribose/xylose/arabinose/galactoside ABC-type transport system permease subunit